MKQHITRLQWDELEKNNKIKYYEILELNIENTPTLCEDVTIGQMIEFLGDDWIKKLSIFGIDKLIAIPNNKNLCDALWEAVKYKLNN